MKRLNAHSASCQAPRDFPRDSLNHVPEQRSRRKAKPNTFGLLSNPSARGDQLLGAAAEGKKRLGQAGSGWQLAKTSAGPGGGLCILPRFDTEIPKWEFASPLNPCPNPFLLKPQQNSLSCLWERS